MARTLAQPPLAPYDVVFLDPPYAVPTADVVATCEALREHGWLAEAALVVVERSTPRRGAAPGPRASRRAARGSTARRRFGTVTQQVRPTTT